MLPNDLELATFTDLTIGDLDSMTPEQYDALPFGVVGMSFDCVTEIYNEAEARLAGIPADTVIGGHYFANTAQCMNNFMVAQRFEDEPVLDTIIDYVLTLRMRPTPVQLRLLKRPGARRYYVLVQR